MNDAVVQSEQHVDVPLSRPPERDVGPLLSMTVAHLLYALLSLTLVRMLPVAMALLGARLHKATVLFMGRCGPRGLASIVLGLVYLEHKMALPGESTVSLAVMATVSLSIFPTD